MFRTAAVTVRTQFSRARSELSRHCLLVLLPLNSDPVYVVSVDSKTELLFLPLIFNIAKETKTLGTNERPAI